MLASYLIEETISHCQNVEKAVAYFYCDHKDEASQDSINILGSLATQLAQQSIESFEVLRNLYRRYRQGREQSQIAESSVLMRIIRRMSETFEGVYIIVDALDECGKRVSEVTKFCATLPDTPNVKIALFSREEEKITQLLAPQLVHVQIAARSEDLSLYVSEEMDRRMKEGALDTNSTVSKQTIKKRLINGADGTLVC